MCTRGSAVADLKRGRILTQNVTGATGPSSGGGGDGIGADPRTPVYLREDD